MSRFLRFAGTGTVFFGMLGSVVSSGCGAAGGKSCSYNTRKERPVIVITKGDNTNAKNEGLSWKSKLLILLGFLGATCAVTYGVVNASDETKEKMLNYYNAYTLVTDVGLRAMYFVDIALKLFGLDRNSRGR